MNLSKILEELKAERTRIDQAIRALENVSGSSSGGTGRGGARPKRRMSAQARKMISEKMKLRWAERRKGKGKSAA